MKNVLLCIILALAIVGTAGALFQLDTGVEGFQIAGGCSSIAPFTATDAGDCFDQCASRYGCGIDRYDASTACCFCGDMF